ncbi:MAG: class I SAM-dependent methyltransferase [Acidobacteria bacterium]|nr:class I SAM-dependent methyltransferase [Acidobacteriota bacterium]
MTRNVRRFFTRGAATAILFVLVAGTAPGSAQITEQPGRNDDYRSYYDFAAYNHTRREARPATSTTVSRTLAEYFPEGDVVEIGCGDGELARLLPHDMMKRLIQTDVYPELLEENPFDTRKMVVDVYDMPFRDGEVPGIVSIEVLDALFDGRKVLGEIHRVLRPGAPMVAFFDMQPSHEIMMQIFPGDILFPVIRQLPGTQKLDGRSDYLKADRAQLLRVFEQRGSGLDPAESAALHSYMNQPAREYTGIFGMGGAERVAAIERFRRILDALEINYEVINGVKSYTEHLQRLLAETGFRIEEAGFRTRAAVVPRADLPDFPADCNCLEYRMGFSAEKNDPGLAPGYIKIESTIYVMAARKKAPPEAAPVPR